MLCLPSSIITSSRGGRPKLQPPALSVNCTSLTANQIAQAIVNWKFNFCKGFSSESRPIVQILLHNWQSFPVEYVGSGHCTCHNTCHRRKRGVSQVTIRLLRKTHHNTVHSVQLGAKKKLRSGIHCTGEFSSNKSNLILCSTHWVLSTQVVTQSNQTRAICVQGWKCPGALGHTLPSSGKMRCTTVHWGTLRYIQLRCSEVHSAQN